MKYALAVWVLAPTLYSAPPLSLTAHYLDVGAGGQSYALAVDDAVNVFAASTAYEPSGRPVIRIIKTGATGDVLAQFDFGEDLGNTYLQPVAAAADAQGNLILAGNVNGAGLPLVSALFSDTTAQAAFLAKFDAPLQHILFSTRLGGISPGFDTFTSAGAVALDGAGNIYIAGGTSSADFPVTPDAFQIGPPASDAFGAATYAYVAELPPDGSRLIFSTYFGGNTETCTGGSGCRGKFGITNANALALDLQGNIVIAGGTSATDLPVTAGTLSQQCGCAVSSTVGFAAKLAAGGGSLLWSTYLNGATEMVFNLVVHAVALDGSGDVIVAGNAANGLPTTPGSVQPADPLGSRDTGGQAGFVAKLDPAASQLLFSTYFGIGWVNALALDAQSGVWLTGTSDPSYLPPPAAGNTPALGPTYVAGLSSDGQAISFLMTAPAGAAGQALATGPVVLGPMGSLLLPGAGSVSLAGIANSGADHVAPFVAPYDLVSFYGLNLGPSTPVYAQVVDGDVTTSIGGVQVLFDGVPAPLLYTGPTQINAVVPSSVSGLDFTQVQVISPNGTVDRATIPVRTSDPQIFHTPGNYAAALNQDGSINAPGNPAAAGSVVVIWATGAGLTYLAPPDGMILQPGGNPGAPILPVSIVYGVYALDSLEVLYAGSAPGDVAGVMQVNFRLPEAPELPFAVRLQVGTMLSDPVGIYVTAQ